MSYKFDSLMIILNKLDSKEKVTVASLVNDLEVSERTVHRYLNTLQVAGYPIYYDREKSSYTFTDDYSLRKPNLSAEESLAFSLSKSLLMNLGTGMEKSLNRIEEKISSNKTDLPRHILLKTDEHPPVVTNYIDTINQAIVNLQKIEITYKTLHSDDKTVRTIEPYYIFFQKNLWYLRGYCLEKEDLRTFALDRIFSLKVLDERFLPKIIQPEEELYGAFGAIVDGDPVKVILRFDRGSKPYILRKKWHQSQKEKELEDGRLEVEFNVNGIEGIKQWIYSWIPYVEIVAPKELKETIKKDLTNALRKV